MRTQKKLLSTTLGVLIATAAADGLADTSGPAAALEEVVVTARKRDEKIQDVPIAITAITGEGLVEKNVVELQDLQQLAPGLTIQSSAFGGNIPAFTIRSQRQFAPYMTADPSTAVYFADVVQARPQGLNSAMYDIESVQVLKGPQGTLFGRNTTGGAVLITPKAPSENLEGYIKGSAGNYELNTLEGAVNVPLNDVLQARISAQHTVRDGYTPNLYNGKHLDDENNDSWRLSLRFLPTDDIENRLVVNGFHANENGVGYKLTYLVNPGLVTTLYPGAPAVLADLQNRPFHVANSNLPNPGANIDAIGVSNTTEWNIGSDLTLKNIAGYRHVDSLVYFDLDGTPFSVFPSQENVDSYQASDELQLSGKAFDDYLDWIVGASYFKETGTEQQLSFAFGARRNSIGDVDNRSKAVFGQGTYRLPSIDTVSITAGLRYTKDERELISHNENAVGVCRLRSADSPTSPLLNPCEAKGDLTFNEPTYTLGVDWKAADHLLLYAVHRKGYRSGGFTLQLIYPSEVENGYAPEFVKDYEVGVKSDFTIAGRPVRLNAAVYYQDYTDIQRSYGVQVNPGLFVTTIINAAEATIKGGELEASWSITDDLELNAHYAYSDPQYGKYVDAEGRDISPTLFIASKHTAGADLRYRLPLSAEIGDVFASVNAYYQSETVYSEQNYDPVTGTHVPSDVIDAYTLINARIEWKHVLGSNADLALFGRNLTDKEYYAGGTDLVAAGSGFSAAFAGAPRTYGIEASYQF